MKKTLSAIVICLLMIGSYLVGRNHKGSPEENPNARRVLYWVDPMHPDYKSDHPGTAPDCGMKLEPVYADDANKGPMAASMTQLVPGTVSVDGDMQQLVGIRLATVEKTRSLGSVRVLGRVTPEDTRVYRIDAGTDGYIRETYNDSVGTLVKKDQKLASCYGPEFLSVASGYLAAIAAVPGSTGKDGNRTVSYPGALSKTGLSSLQGYTDRLRNLGMSEYQINEMAENRQLPSSVDLVSPASGFILSRSITPGQHFDRSMEFYRIADLSRVWIVADVFGTEAQNVRPGTVAHVKLADQGKSFTARVTNILPQVDPNTRTLKLRLEADNPGFVLRPDMFVSIELPVSTAAALTVPVDAVVNSGEEQRVFVERAAGLFEPRKVQTGWHVGDRIEILDGLKEGERIVSSGTFLVDSESRLKAVQAASKAEPQQNAVPPKAAPEAGVAVSDGKVKDAACGMMIDKAQAIAEGHTVTRDGVTYYFCSDRCKKKFSAQPEQHAALNSLGPSHD
jgi:membrane fusion protein, copper/silver efflux system